MTSSSSAITKPAEQPGTTPVLGGIMQEWRQWLAPGVVVAVVLAMGSLQRADIRELGGKIDRVNTELSAEIRDVNGKVDRVNDRIDQMSDRIDQMNDRIDQMNDRISDGIAQVSDRIDHVNRRIDRLYQLLLP